MSEYVYDPRRVHGQDGVDWQERVNFERLRKERLERARSMMKKHGLGALICFNGENIRYITSTWQGNWKANIFVRYCVLPENGEPVLFETVGADMECAIIDAPWLKGRIKPAITWVWSGPAQPVLVKKMAESIKNVLKENGVAQEKVGLDVFD
jgi:Xaa-Pro aminopeptidase